MGKYRIYSYEDAKGKDLIELSVLKFNKPQRAKFSRLVEYLKIYGISRDNPMLKKIVGTRIWEMRSLGKDNIRMFCAPYLEDIVILHVFIKKSQKTNLKDLLLAESRYSDLIE